MRLTCPNCGAMYEVQDALIPASGRDVQCSACSTTWFQPGANAPEAEPEPDAVSAEAEPDAAPTDVPAAEPEEAPARSPQATTFARPPQREAAFASRTQDAQPARTEPAEGAPEAPAEMTSDKTLSDDIESATQVVEVNAPEDEYDADEAEIEAEAVAPVGGARRGLDPSVRDILRSEAEREARLREAEASPVETQSEMSLEEGGDRSDPMRRRQMPPSMDDVREAGATDTVRPIASRGDLLPDIEEINSTLRAHPPHGSGMAEVAPQPPSPEVVRRRGVRIGFFTTLALVAALAWMYANADDVVAALPGAGPALERYATSVDGARLWLDDLARGLAEGRPDA